MVHVISYCYPERNLHLGKTRIYGSLNIFSASYNGFHLYAFFVFLITFFFFSSDRTVKIWRARGGLDSTLDADNADDVASNWTQLWFSKDRTALCVAAARLFVSRRLLLMLTPETFGWARSNYIFSPHLSLQQLLFLNICFHYTVLRSSFWVVVVLKYHNVTGTSCDRLIREVDCLCVEETYGFQICSFCFAGLPSLFFILSIRSKFPAGNVFSTKPDQKSKLGFLFFNHLW